MSKRLQVLLPETQYRALSELAAKSEVSVSDIVRSCIEQTLAFASGKSVEARIAAVLKYSRFNGPTGDIEQVLAEIEEGRTVE